MKETLRRYPLPPLSQDVCWATHWEMIARTSGEVFL